MRKQSSGGSTQVFRITGARQGLAEDVRGRQRRYVISMGVRTVAVILAVTLWEVERPVAIVALVFGAVLPYIAVVIANAGRENAPSLPSTFVTAQNRPTIAPSRADDHTDDRTDKHANVFRDGFAESVPEDVAAERAEGLEREPRERT